MIPVPYFEYLNVRIKGYQSRLFTRDTCEDLIGGDNLGGLTTFLLDHPDYGSTIEKALEGHHERKGLENGVTDYFTQRISDILHMSGDQSRELLEIALHSFNLKNLRSLIIAHHGGMSYRSAKDMFIPCGSIDREDLSSMLSTKNLGDVSLILGRRYPIGAEALKKALDTFSPSEPVLNIVNDVEKNVYGGILRSLSRTDDDSMALKEVFRLEIDMKNVTSALKFVWEGLKPAEDSEIFIRGGSVNMGYLHEISVAASLDEAFEMLESTPFRPAVEKGIIYYAETGFLHEMERFFEEVFIRKTQSYRRFNPFGVGVFIGFLWAQFAEMTNLRTIINGISFGLGSGQIRKGLIYV
jgi:vacuolar-type H+-ATPase subunit C/Vma6